MNYVPWAVILRSAIAVMAIAAGRAGAAAAPARTTAAATATSTAPVVFTQPEAIVTPWKPIFRGIDAASATAAKPRPIKAHAVRIDLRESTIEFIVTPSNGDRPKETDGLRTSTFLTKYKCQVALNASPFDPLVKADGEPQDVVGLSISRGDAYSASDARFGSLLISRKNKAWIVTPPIDTKDAYNAVGGFRTLLEKGKNVGTRDALHPRSAVGVSKDGRYLYLVAIDGRQKGYSEGTFTGETAEWMRLFGAYDALNLDGGGSTALVIDDGQGGAKALNRPINANVPGNERVCANHIGVYAKALPAKRH